MMEPTSSSNPMESFPDEIPSTPSSNRLRRRRRGANLSISTEGPQGSDVACSVSFFIMLVVLAMIILAITLGVTIPQEQQNQSLRTGTNSNDEQQPSAPSSPVGTTPTNTPISSPTSFPPPSSTLSPTTMNKEQYLRSIVMQWSGSEVDQPATPAHLALGWLSTVDPKNLGKESSERDIRQRYIAAVIYFALKGQSWQSGKKRRLVLPSQQQRQIQEMRTIFGFLSGKDVCNWNMDSMGISCDGDGNIETIQLFDLFMKGTFPKEIGYLTDLNFLDMSNNDIGGTLPSEIGLLSKLHTLDLRSNHISGTIPTEIGGLPNLQYLQLGRNKLHGPVPTQLGNLLRLEVLDLATNTLATRLPTSIGGLTDLTSLRLAENGLTGTLPTEMGMLVNLNDLQLYINQFTGTIPTYLGRLSLLDNLNMNDNMLKGTLPTELGSLVAMTELRLARNQFDSTIPTEIGRMPLQVLDLSQNRLHGSIPTSLASLTTVFTLNLGHNNMTGVIPEEFAQNSRLVNLYFQGNNFNGNLDSTFCPQQTLLSLTIKNLQADCLGSPPEIECSCCTLCCEGSDGYNCTNPNAIPATLPTLSPNAGLTRFEQLLPLLQPFSGDAPLSNSSSPQYKAAWWLATTDGLQLDFSTVSTDKIVQRYVLALLWYALGGEGWSDSRQYLSDLLTCLWGGITCNDEGLITEIDLGNNQLIGWLPSEIGFFPNLEVLLLEGNGLTGSIPSTLFLMDHMVKLSLSSNLLSGSIPTEIGKLSSCRFLDLSNNHLSGPPPNITELVLVEEVYLDRNKLAGRLPTDFVNSLHLKKINLFSNDLAGPIPVNLFSAPVLEQVDLSDNLFTGSLPTNFGLSTVLETLRLGANPGIRGTLPTELGHISALIEFDCNDCGLKGGIPTEVALLTSLEILVLADNLLSAPLPSQIMVMPSLVTFDISRNAIVGSIPSSIAMKRLEAFRAQNNKLTGKIPTQFGSLSNLTELIVRGNNLTGDIPTELGQIAALSILDLSHNSIGGQVPSEIGTLRRLTDIYLQGTNIIGNLDDLFCAATLSLVAANCGGDSPSVVCTCCTLCCDSSGSNCEIP